MSQLNRNYVDYSNGMPPQDLSLRNFKTTANTVSNRFAGRELQVAGLVAGDVVVDQGSFNTLVVSDLIVTGASQIVPETYTILPNPVAVLGFVSPAVANPTYTYPRITFSAVAQTATWTLQIPASTTRKLVFDCFDTVAFTVTVNGTLIGTITGSGVKTTSAFDWPGGLMTVVLKCTVTGSINNDPIAA